MGILVSVFEHRKCLVFLNISFLLVVASVFLIVYFNPSDSGFLVLSSSNHLINGSNQQGCKGLQSIDDYKAKCLYLKSNMPCVSLGYINYLYLFYCNLGRFPLLGNFLLFIWLLVLFYLLGNTASEYFCASLESLSSLLNLSPTISGVTLLSLGNGAPDVFASLVSFMGTGTGDIGLNTVVGGASFVTCVVVGIISILMHRKRVRVSKSAFVRDVCFFLLVLASLLVILIYGEINLWAAMGFSSMYIVYVIVIYFSHMRPSKGVLEDSERDANSSYGSDLSIPILSSMEKGEVNCVEEVASEGEIREESKKSCFCLKSSAFLFRILEMPLYLPRRLTIPVVCETKWSKPFAVASVTLAPLLLAALWSHQDHEIPTFNITRLVINGIGLLFGITFGILVYAKTEKSSPPRKCLFPWLAGGFFMSMIWSYITAQELVALLVSLGHIYEISPSILGLTVLSWGNSLGDLMTNVTMALNGGSEGMQVAISGCYAGPIFNTLFGLGLSLVGSSWYAYPSPVLITKDPYLLETIGFLMGGLLWALVVLPRRDMRLGRVLGGGLLALYLISMSLRLIQTTGSLQLQAD